MTSMKPFGPIFLLLCFLLCASSSWAFTTTLSQRQRRPGTVASSSPTDSQEDPHPAVVGWPEKYVSQGGSEATKNESRVISDVFAVHLPTEAELQDLDVPHWPTWTTADKPKWDVGNQVVDKEMPYGELSYIIKGKLEIIPQSLGYPVVLTPGDLVTFPKGSVASWKVLEELTWHYYLY